MWILSSEGEVMAKVGSKRDLVRQLERAIGEIERQDAVIARMRGDLLQRNGRLSSQGLELESRLLRIRELEGAMGEFISTNVLPPRTFRGSYSKPVKPTKGKRW